MNACPKMCSRHGRRTITPSRKRSIQWNLKWLEKATLVLPILKKQPKRLFLLKLGTLSVLETCKKNDEKKISALRIHCTTQFLSENDKNEWWEFHLKKKILIFSNIRITVIQNLLFCSYILKFFDNDYPLPCTY